MFQICSRRFFLFLRHELSPGLGQSEGVCFGRSLLVFIRKRLEILEFRSRGDLGGLPVASSSEKTERPLRAIADQLAASLYLIRTCFRKETHF